MEEIIIGTDENGKTNTNFSSKNVDEEMGIDYMFNYPKNSWIIARCEIVPRLEGYRLVTQEEWKKYDFPDCAYMWQDSTKTWINSDGIKSLWGWTGAIFAVPNDYKFKIGDEK